MIGLSAPTADANGAVILNEHPAKSQANEPPARLSKSKCLDASVSITHSGVVDGDRLWRYVIPQISEDAYAVVKHLHRAHTTITLACKDGVFVGVIVQPRMSGGDCIILIEAKEKLSA